MKKLSLLLIACVLCLSTNAAAQSCWWEPQAPQIGQSLTIYYDINEGTIPAGPSPVLLHWGVYDPETTDWSLPPLANWPAGSVDFQGSALQSTMIDNGAGIWSLTLDSVEDMDHIAWVFTNGTDWDNNSDTNWGLSYVISGTVCWWTPLEPEVGETVSLYYDTAAGSLPGTADVVLHWGVNETGHGNWQLAPEEMWPAGSSAIGVAVQSPLTDIGDGIWTIELTVAELIHSVHWVFTDGSNWDSNSDANWNIFIGEPPVLNEVHTRFLFDPRSVNYSGPAIVNEVCVRGQFNNWSDGVDNLQSTDGSVWVLDKVLNEGSYEYKFFVNGEFWTWDPDNPDYNANDNSNSIVSVVASAAPRLRDFSHSSGLVLDEPTSITLQTRFWQPDSGELIDWAASEILINGIVSTFEHEDETVNLDLVLNEVGELTVDFRIVDIDGDELQTQWRRGYQTTGFHLLDCSGDDDGGGSYNYPTPFDGYADIEALRFTQQAEGDTLRIEIALELVHDYSKIALQINREMDVETGSDHLGEELNTPDWQNAGIFMTFMDPASTWVDPELDNRLLLGFDPPQSGAELDIWKDGNSLFVNIPMDLIEERLGGWMDYWYFACWSMLTGIQPVVDGVMEIDESTGGVAEAYEPDVYDLAWVDTQELENILLNNYSLGRTAALDADGRGFVAILPEMIGPDMGAPGPRINFLTQPSATIVANRNIAGEVGESATGQVLLIHQDNSGVADTTYIDPVDGLWEYSYHLSDGMNTFQAQAIDADEDWGFSSQLLVEYLLDHAPQVRIDMTLNDGTLLLLGGNTIDVDGDISTWQWEADENNPLDIVIDNSDSMVGRISNIPATDGSYFVKLTVEDSQGNQDFARANFEVELGQLQYVGQEAYPLWVRDAIVYEIFVRSFDAARDLNAVTARMDEIADLGVNTIWLMPIFEGPSDHGYAINDYYSIEADYGTMEDFDALVEAAHDYGLKVVLDMVANHCSIDHSWMASAQQHGEYSQSHDYFMWNPDGTHQYYYDWQSLPNFNISNPDLKREIFDMSAWWVNEHNIDGYRCDVAWGPMERDPSYWNGWRNEIRKQRPDLFLLAEAGAGDFSIYENRFNLAYDWDFFWQIIGQFDTVNPATVQDRVSNFGFWYPDYGIPFRFTENHDEARFIAENGLEKSRTAAALIFSVPGVPLIYAGQEVGETSARDLINWNDSNNLRPFYKRLCEIRTEYLPMRGTRLTQLDNNSPSSIYSIARDEYAAELNQVMLIAHNLSNNPRTSVIDLSPADWGMDSGTWYLTNLMNGEIIEYTAGVPTEIEVDFQQWDSKFWLLADEVASIDNPGEPTKPLEFELGQAYPNPFNPVTTIPYTLQRNVEELHLSVYNIMGQKVSTLYSGPAQAGSHSINWDASRQASGVYFLHLEAANGTLNSFGKVLLMK
jgi:cyclomaltodextrinase / maltogenic alpha-amylase / neopullulanase